MIRKADTRNSEVRLVEKTLRAEFPSVKAKKYGLGSIRVRIIDPRFAGKGLADREELVEPVLKRLPKEVYCDITVLLTLAPGEEATSMMNYEFEHPSRSAL